MSELEAQARKYVPRPHSVVPTSGGYALFEARGFERRFVALLPDAASLAAYLEDHFQAEAARGAAQRRAAESRASALRDLEIDFSL